MTINISLEELVKTGAHFGHQSKRWNPRMDQYLHGVRDGVHVFDLIKTKELLEEALDYLRELSKSSKKILFVGTKKQAKELVIQTAKDSGQMFVSERWLGGTLTNFEQMKRSVRKLSEMKEKRVKGEYSHLTKKERLLIDREIARLERFFGGISDITQLPDALIVVDVKKEKGAVAEANAKAIPVVAMVDSNCDPTGIDYPIPMNDDATKAIEYVLGLMREAILSGKKGTKGIKSITSSKGEEQVTSDKKISQKKIK